MKERILLKAHLFNKLKCMHLACESRFSVLGKLAVCLAVGVLVYSSMLLKADAATIVNREFRIAWASGTTYGILLTQPASDNDIEKFVYELREIRKRSEFNKYFPVHELNHMKDPYSLLQVQIFTDPKWASRDIKKRWADNKMPKQEVQVYFNNIRGYYGWQKNPGFERGSIGDRFRDKSTSMQSRQFKALF